MALVTTKEMFAKALQSDYAIGAFNVNNMEIIQGIVEAAKIEQSPLILQVSAGARKYAKPAYLTKLVEAAILDTGLDIALHLDHGEDFDICKKCVDDGFTSVMIDGSHYPYEENVAITKSVCDYAHAHGVTVEGELGTISGIEDGVSSDKGLYTDPQQALDFVRRTGVDSLAVAVGTSHGAYKFKPGQKPKLRFDILQEIEQVLPELPIVLHGASSVNQEDVKTINEFGGSIQKAIGIPEEMLAEAAKMAVCKVNVDTDLRLAMTAAVRKTLSEDPAVIDTRKYIGAGRSLVKERVAYKMENILHSAHRY